MEESLTYTVNAVTDSRAYHSCRSRGSAPFKVNNCFIKQATRWQPRNRQIEDGKHTLNCKTRAHAYNPHYCSRHRSDRESVRQFCLPARIKAYTSPRLNITTARLFCFQCQCVLNTCLNGSKITVGNVRLRLNLSQENHQNNNQMHSKENQKFSDGVEVLTP